MALGAIRTLPFYALLRDLNRQLFVQFTQHTVRRRFARLCAAAGEIDRPGPWDAGRVIAAHHDQVARAKQRKFCSMKGV